MNNAILLNAYLWNSMMDNGFLPGSHYDVIGRKNSRQGTLKWKKFTSLSLISLLLALECLHHPMMVPLWGFTLGSCLEDSFKVVPCPGVPLRADDMYPYGHKVSRPFCSIGDLRVSGLHIGSGHRDPAALELL